jgi:arylsulfatase A-like enzyme
LSYQLIFYMAKFDLNSAIRSYFLLSLIVLSFTACKVDSTPPNIVYILADDMGYGDVSAYNEDSKIRTPAIDRLVAEGMQFTDAHSNSAVCTPTRYGILTGRYAWRTWMKKGVLWSYDLPLIPKERETVASLLKDKGYRTACIGKWHLGLGWQKDSLGMVNLSAPLTESPNDIGFDYFYGIPASLDIPPYLYFENHTLTSQKIDTIEGTTGQGFWRRGPIGEGFRHIDVLPHFTEKAVQYIEEQSSSKEPFFLYFPLPAPHTPILPTDAFKGQSPAGNYGDFTEMVDDVVRQVTQALENTGQTENTLIIFTSDNGCSPAAGFEELAKAGHSPSYVYRGAKADIYEGGHRVPFVARWPKQIKPGSKYEHTVSLTDLMATVAAITGAEMAPNAGEDSVSMLPLWTADSLDTPLREATVHHSIEGMFAIRKDKWKLIFGAGSGGWSAPIPKVAAAQKLPQLQLYDLMADPGERQNLAAQYPAVVSELTELLQDYVDRGRSTVGPVQQNDTPTQFKPIPYANQ